MKTYFLKLFDYDRHANLLIYEAMVKAGSSFKAKQLILHLLTAQQVWLNRCTGLPPVAGKLWVEIDQNMQISAHQIDEMHKAWSDYLITLENNDFSDIIAYTNSRGESYTNKLSDICTHVINHGTHHRAQIGQYLKTAGLKNLPPTDFIAFIR